MKKLLTLIPLAFLIFSCQEKEVTKEEYRKIDPLLNIAFKDSFSNFIGNDLVFNNAFKFLESKKDSIIENNILDDMPLEIFKVFKNPKAEGAIIHFIKHPTTKYYNFNQRRDTIFSDFVTFDLLAAIPENQAKDLSKGQMFYVKSKKHFIDISPISDLFTNQTYYQRKFHIEHSRDEISINYGILFTEVDSLLPFTPIHK